MDNHYNHFKKIDAHSHIGKFGSPFNIDFDLSRLTEQMEEYNIEKTILCPAGCHLNKELKEAYPDLVENVNTLLSGSGLTVETYLPQEVSQPETIVQ